MSHTNLALGANWDGEWPEYVEVSHEGAGDGRRYVPERTCRIAWNGEDETWECDACGGAVGLVEVNYCENCGAKGVGE